MARETIERRGRAVHSTDAGGVACRTNTMEMIRVEGIGMVAGPVGEMIGTMIETRTANTGVEAETILGMIPEQTGIVDVATGMNGTTTIITAGTTTDHEMVDSRTADWEIRLGTAVRTRAASSSKDEAA